MENKITDSYFTDAQAGPLVTFDNLHKNVMITWKDPPNDYTRHLKVMPAITDWDEYDHVCFTLGKSIMDYFLNKGEN